LSETATTGATKPRSRRWLRALAWIGIALVALLAGGYLFLGSQAALDYVVRRAVEASGGHLVIEGAEGSLLSTVRIARLLWTGDELDVEARDTAVSWSPFDLLSRKVSVDGLGAKLLSIDFKKGESKSQGGMPSTLALPVEVDVRNIGVERLEWKTIAQHGAVSGIVFNYAGGAVRHEIRDLRLVAEPGRSKGLRASARTRRTS
jgi:autotransporter translocation and assembly factor TamB